VDIRNNKLLRIGTHLVGLASWQLTSIAKELPQAGIWAWVVNFANDRVADSWTVA